MEYPSIRRAKEKLATSRAPRIQFCVRFYGDELIEVKKRARLLGKSVSAYVRDCCLGDFISTVYTENDNTALTDSLPLKENSSPDLKPITRHPSAKVPSNGTDSQEEPFEVKDAQDGAKKKEESREKLLELVSRKTGHRKFCNCFACERLLSILKDAKL